MSEEQELALDGRTVVWKPQPKQKLAMKCPAFELLYGGSKGGMKTAFLVACILQILRVAHDKWKKTGQKQKKCRIIVFRKNLEDIKDFIAKTFELYPHFDPEMGTDGFHVKDKYWEFTSGATVEMRHLDGPTDHEGYQGNEFVAVLFDEVQYISYEAYSFLVAQVRSSDPDYRKLLMVRCTANPGGPFGEWVKRYFFIDKYPDGGKLVDVETKLADGRTVTIRRAFIRSYLRDNPFLDPDGRYEAQLRATLSPEQVRQYLDGDFDCVSGAFFAHLLRPQVHFVKSFPIPSTWDMHHASDWGSTAPACTHIGASDNDNRVYVIDELHRPGISGEAYGEAMAEMWKFQKWSKDHVWSKDAFWGVVDTQAMHEYNGPATPASGIMKCGFRLFGAEKGPGDRKVGINQIIERLRLDRHGKPQVVIFEDRCPKLVAALKGIQSKPLDIDDYDPKSPLAHAVDSFRFLLMLWPVEPADTRDPVDVQVAAWERMIAAKAARPYPSNDGGFQSGYG